MGVRVGAYLISKAVVLFPLAVVQTGVLALIVFALRPLHEPSGTYVVVIALLALTSFTAVGMGLLLSALARSEDQATSLIPLVLIPQLLFAGAIVSVARMGDLIALFSNGAFSRWAFAGVGSVAEMNDRLRGDPAALAAYGTDFFDLSSPVATLVLIGFMAALLVAVRMLLERLR